MRRTSSKVDLPWLRTLLRVLAVPAVLMAFAAPSPGDIGSCSDTSSAADAVTHCRAKKEVICQRRAFRGEFGPMGSMAAQAGLNDCVAGIAVQCAGAVWPVGCSPTPDDSDRCIQALYVNPQDSAGDNPPECQLCEAM